jgi:hypothetical protein
LIQIYALSDPRDNAIRYVGKSCDALSRLHNHCIRRGENTQKDQWIVELTAAGATPTLVILEEVPDGEWETAERKWIATARESGWPILNVLPGGKQPPLRRGVTLSADVCARISRGLTGRECGPITRARIAHSNTGKSHSAETKAKLSAISTGKHPSAETREKLSAALKGNTHTKGKTTSPDTKAKLSAAMKGRQMSEEWRRKISEAKKGTHHSDETKSKISAASKAMRHSEQTKAQMRESQRGRRERERLAREASWQPA